MPSMNVKSSDERGRAGQRRRVTIGCHRSEDGWAANGHCCDGQQAFLSLRSKSLEQWMNTFLEYLHGFVKELYAQHGRVGEAIRGGV
jgi:hypothetical protein